MRRSKAEIYLHLVWATHKRKALLTEDIERAVYRCIESEAHRSGCVVLAIGGMPDHVHLLVQVPSTVSAAALAKQVKGVSSTMVRDRMELEEPFRWQENYAAFSVSRSHLTRVMDYVKNQKARHATGKLWDGWEEADEEKPVGSG